MKLDAVAITGADDDVALRDLNALAADFPFVEIALLLLPENMGAPRCPTERWIRDFNRLYTGTRKAIHLCGGALLGFVNGDKSIFDLMTGFSRIQLNLKFGDVEGKYDEAALIARIRESVQFEFIVQYTDDKAHLLAKLRDIPNHALLFDASAGRGVSPDKWPAPLPGHRCGYAGGLNPENIAEQLARLAAVCPGATWIDMESGVRTGDRFDIGKIRSVLETASPYIA